MCFPTYQTRGRGQRVQGLAESRVVFEVGMEPIPAHRLLGRLGTGAFGPQTRLRVGVGDPQDPSRRFQPPGGPDRQAYELSLVHDWPAAGSFGTRRIGVDVTPHAGVGMTSYGGLAEAGATVQVSQRRDDVVKEKLGAMGVRDGKPVQVEQSVVVRAGEESHVSLSLPVVSVAQR